MRFCSYLAVLGLALVCQGSWAQLPSDQAPVAEGVAVFEPSAVSAQNSPEVEAESLNGGISTNPSLAGNDMASASILDSAKAGLKKYWLVLVIVTLALSWWIQGRLVKRPE